MRRQEAGGRADGEVYTFFDDATAVIPESDTVSTDLFSSRNDNPTGSSAEITEGAVR